MNDKKPDTTQELLEVREGTHGSFKVNARVYRLFCNVVQQEGAKLNTEQGLAMDMIFVKLARIVSGNANTKDHWEDIAGYAKLGSEACE